MIICNLMFLNWSVDVLVVEMIFRWLYLSLRTQVTSILLFKRGFYLSVTIEPVSETFFRDWFWLLIWRDECCLFIKCKYVCLITQHTHVALVFVQQCWSEGRWLGEVLMGHMGVRLMLSVSLSCSLYLIKNASRKLVGHRCWLQRADNTQYSQHVLTC